MPLPCAFGSFRLATEAKLMELRPLLTLLSR